MCFSLRKYKQLQRNKLPLKRLITSAEFHSEHFLISMPPKNKIQSKAGLSNQLHISHNIIFHLPVSVAVSFSKCTHSEFVI